MKLQTAFLIVVTLVYFNSALGQTTDSSTQTDIYVAPDRHVTPALEAIISPPPLMLNSLLADSLKFNALVFPFSLPGITTTYSTLGAYSRSQPIPLSQSLNFIGSTERIIHMGMGEYTSLSTALRWAPSARLYLSAGTSFHRQFSYTFPKYRQDLLGFNSSIRYNLFKRLHLNVWGQHVLPLNSATLLFSNPLFLQTKAGSSISAPLNSNSNISVGIEYQYDQNKGMWIPESKGGVKIGF